MSDVVQNTNLYWAIVEATITYRKGFFRLKRKQKAYIILPKENVKKETIEQSEACAKQLAERYVRKQFCYEIKHYESCVLECDWGSVCWQYLYCNKEKLFTR